MNKKLASIMCGLVMASTIAPAFAADAGSESSVPDVLRGLTMTPAKIAAFGISTVIGTPIAVVRMTAHDTKKCVNDFGWKSDNMMLKAVSPFVGIPAGVFTGGVEGTWMGWTNAWNNNKTPWGKDALSLGDMKDD
jgi:hypothetical protein